MRVSIAFLLPALLFPAAPAAAQLAPYYEDASLGFKIRPLKEFRYT